MKKYCSPEVKFEQIKLDKAIADKCWAWANNSPDDEDKCYYNTPGKGYIQFKVTGSDCSDKANLSVVITGYFDGADSSVDKDFNDWWTKKVPNGDSDFKGTGYSDGKPDPSWS